MLQQIPYIHSKLAASVQTAFPSLRELMEELEEKGKLTIEDEEVSRFVSQRMESMVMNAWCVSVWLVERVKTDNPNSSVDKSTHRAGLRL